MSYIMTIRTCFPILLLCFFLSSGCTRQIIKITETSPDSKSIAISQTKTKTPAIIGFIKVRGVSSKDEASQLFRLKLIEKLIETRLFEDVYEKMPSVEPQKFIQFNLSVGETKDSHDSGNLINACFVGCSLYMLSPVFRYKYSLLSRINLEVVRSDGKKKQYTANSKGTAHYLTGITISQAMANQFSATNALHRRVTKKNLNSLMNQLIKDSQFILDIP